MKKISVSLLVIALLLQSFPLEAIASDPGVQEKLEQLDLRLPRLGEGARRGRYWGSGILLAGAVGFGVGAIVESHATSADHQSNATALGISAGVLGIVGGLELMLPTAFETWPEEYEKLPGNSAEEKAKKVDLGEDYLNRLAERARQQRIWSSAIITAVGAAETVGGAVSQASDKSGEITLGALLTVLGAVGFFLKRPAECERDNYYAWRERKPMAELQWDLAPVKGGASLVAGLRF